MNDNCKGVQRTSCPDTGNKCYLRTEGGGYNKCIAGNSKNPYNKRPTAHSVLPNCVGYAYGRYLEYHGLQSANLPTCNARDWYSTAKKAGFACSKTPTVGAVACFKGTQYGHVAFVEKIEKNGDLVLTESNWGHQIFRTVRVTKQSGYRYSGSLQLVGFIAPQAVPKTEKPTAGTYRVTANSLNVRYGTSTKLPARAVLGKGATVEISKVKTGLDGQTWGKIPKTGWVCLAYAERVAA